MKRMTAAMTIAGLAMFTIPSSAAAQEDYGSASPTAKVSNSSPEAGGSFTASVTNCAEQGTTFQFEGNSKAGSTDSDGDSSATFTAPTSAGTYTGTVTCGADVASFSVAVAATPAAATPTGGLPATGSSGSGTTIAIASILLLAGLGMFGVAQMRRRQVTA